MAESRRGVNGEVRLIGLIGDGSSRLIHRWNQLLGVRSGAEFRADRIHRDAVGSIRIFGFSGLFREIFDTCSDDVPDLGEHKDECQTSSPSTGKRQEPPGGGRGPPPNKNKIQKFR